MPGVLEPPAASLLQALIAALETLASVSRRLHPPDLPVLAAGVRPSAAAVRDGLARLPAAGEAAGPREHVACLEEAAEEVCHAFDGLDRAAAEPKGFVHAYRAMRAATRASEALYPLAASSPEVSRFFLEPSLRDDPAVRARLERSGSAHHGLGIQHVDNPRENRGGYSTYVPEYYDDTTACPLIVALHGGSGHGADFLWTWLPQARSRGAVLISPTSIGTTWALGGPDYDTPRIEQLVRDALARWNIDRSRILLTGMSDGGTFTYLSGLRAASPFTHLAPVSASFHPSLVDAAAPARLAGLPVYIVHGSLDWMFPADFAHIAAAALRRAGADVTLREIEDLSHTYPRDENPRIMDWFLGTPAAGAR